MISSLPGGANRSVDLHVKTIQLNSTSPLMNTLMEMRANISKHHRVLMEHNTFSAGRAVGDRSEIFELCHVKSVETMLGYDNIDRKDAAMFEFLGDRVLNLAVAEVLAGCLDTNKAKAAMSQVISNRNLNDFLAAADLRQYDADDLEIVCGLVRQRGAADYLKVFACDLVIYTLSSQAIDKLESDGRKISLLENQRHQDSKTPIQRDASRIDCTDLSTFYVSLSKMQLSYKWSYSQYAMSKQWQATVVIPLLHINVSGKAQSKQLAQKEVLKSIALMFGCPTSQTEFESSNPSYEGYDQDEEEGD